MHRDLVCCALSISGALVLELERFFSGLSRLSDAPLYGALAQLGR